jgi:hypothetical protein
MRKPTCWICTGRSTSLCARHKRAVIERAANENIDRETAAFDLRDFEIEVRDAQAARKMDARALAER